jgi:signal transduction histidine kinase/DNA-binding response OmpR family regulator
MAKILIIDDRPRNRQFLTTLLGYQNHHLSEASDGDEGLRVAREQRPDLIISDVLMPTMDGYEFVRRLREEPEIGKTTVVFNTAHYLSHESKALADKCGVSSIIFKPCEPQVVLDIVAAALAEQAESEPEALAQPEEFDREHLKLLTNKLSEKADQVRDAHEKLTALIELSTDLAEERDPVELLNRYCSVAREVIGARWTLVALLERDQKAVHHVGAVGIDLEDSPALRSALLEAGIFKTLVNEGRTICLSDVTSTPGALRLPDSLPRAASLLVVPLIIRGCIDGWICLADKLGLDAFSEQDERLAVALAAKMAIAYDNARLYSDSMKYAGNLKETNQQLEQALQQLQGKTNELTAMTQQLWQASKLATMGELAASIAHELNNPLATVGLRAETLLVQMPADSDPRKSLEIIAQEVDRMATLVNNLLQFSRRSHRQVSTLDLREEIATSVEFVHYHLRTQQIEVVREFAECVPMIQADRQQLHQLFLNLLTNASDAMPQGGKLIVRVSANGLPAGSVVIDFADSGQGISAENLEKIWEPFFTTKPEGKGTGLGLAICRRIVEEHGGTIDIQSESGRGTTVHIAFPATDKGASS